MGGTMAQAGGEAGPVSAEGRHETFIDGQCTFSAQADGSFYLESPLAEYFVYVNLVKPGGPRDGGTGIRRRVALTLRSACSIGMPPAG